MKGCINFLCLIKLGWVRANPKSFLYFLQITLIISKPDLLELKPWIERAYMHCKIKDTPNTMLHVTSIIYFCNIRKHNEGLHVCI